jgi:WD40 repeat protein
MLKINLFSDFALCSERGHILRMTLGQPARLPLATLVVLIMAACTSTSAAPSPGGPVSTSQPGDTPAPQQAAAAPIPSEVAAATATPVSWPVQVDINIDLPYQANGGAVPEHALARIGIGDIYDAEVYPDGQKVALATSTGVYVYTIPGLDLVWRRTTHEKPTSLGISPDGSRLFVNYEFALPSDAMSPQLYDAQTGQNIDMPSTRWIASWSPAGNLLLSEARFVRAEEAMSILIVDGTTGELRRAFGVPFSGWDLMGGGGSGSAVGDYNWSPDGKYAAACSYYSRGDYVYNLWNAETGEEQAFTVARNRGGVVIPTCVDAFSPDSSRLALAVQDETLIIDLPSGDIVERHVGAAGHLVWSSEGLIARFEDTIELHYGTGWVELTPALDASTLSVSPSGELLAILWHEDTQITVYDLSTRAELYTAQAPAPSPITGSDIVTRPGWSPDGQWLALSAVNEYGLRSPQPQTVFHAEDGTVALSYRGSEPLFVGENTILARGELFNNHVALLDVRSGAIVDGFSTDRGVKAFVGDGPAYELSFRWFENNQTLEIKDGSHQVYWSEGAGSVLDAPPSSAGALALQLQEPLVAYPYPYSQATRSVSPDNSMRASFASRIVAVAEGGQQLTEGHLQLFDNNTGSLLYEFDFGDTGVYSTVWSDDGGLLAVSLTQALPCYPGSLAHNQIIMINARTGEQLMTLEGHLGAVIEMIFSPDGSRLASYSCDRSLIIWQTPG